MSYQLIPIILLLLAIVGLIILIARHFPEALENNNPKSVDAEPHKAEVNYFLSLFLTLRGNIVFWAKRLWHFMLEAKGMKHSAVVGYKIKKIFKKEPKKPSMDGLSQKTSQPTFLDENYYLALIKKEPHNLSFYNSLGQFYLEQENTGDASAVYEYLVNHDPANSEYYAKLAYCKLKAKLPLEAASLYEKSLALDSRHPSRYYNLALAYKEGGEVESSLKALVTALEQEPDNAKYLSLKVELEDLDTNVKK